MPYQELCETATGEAPSAEPPDEEWFADQVLHFLEQNGERAHQALCVRFRYFERMNAYEYFTIPLPLVIFLTRLVSDTLGGCGLVSMSWITMKQILDRFCGCGRAPRIRKIPSTL